jgi:hypothetical protein
MTVTLIGSRAMKMHFPDDRNLTVVVEISGQYFRKMGYAEIGSHCYGDYENSWRGELEEVFPWQKSVTVYEAV